LAIIPLDIVLVSPLRRAIQTAYYLFRDHPNKPKLIVVPFLREMLSSSCDIGGNLIQTMAEYP
jgi:broad specificity phosphatase PhoE